MCVAFQMQRQSLSGFAFTNTASKVWSCLITSCLKSRDLSRADRPSVVAEGL